MKILDRVDEVLVHVKSSTSLRQVLQKLGVRDSGGNYQSLKRLLVKYNIDTSHLHGRVWNKGRTFKPKPLEEYLVKGGPVITTLRLKNRLLREGYFERKCYNCGLTEWLGLPIPLELEHIDGDTSNNEWPNLTLLCPNCHALTPTYRGKNKKR